ncbi:MAG: cytochrome P450 [Pseudonocardiaceae bacterium]
MSTPTLSGGVPLLGHAVAFALRPLKFLESARDRGDVVVFRLGTKPAYLVNTPELVREVLVTQYHAFAKGGPFFEAVAPVLGNGLLTANGTLHRRQRRLMQPVFHHTHIASYATTMTDSVVTLSASWRPSQILDVNREMTALTIAALSKCLFAETPGLDVVATFQASLPTVVKGIFTRTVLPIAWLHRIPTPENRRYQAASRRLHDTIDQVITDYRAHDTDRSDLLSMLLRARDEETGESMSNQQIHDEVLTIMSAGTETTMVTLSWAFYVLGARPDIEKRIHAEVDDILDGRPAGLDDIPRLNYVGRVIQEVLRVYPPVWVLTRRTVTDVDLGGHHLPANADVFFSPYALHHDPGLFPEPDTIDPDRWLPTQAEDIKRGTCIPFGSGTRKCIGESFATVETILALATFASRWRLRPIPGRPPQPTAHATYFPANLRMTAEPRHQNHANDQT